jgi:hypothetical protein
MIVVVTVEGPLWLPDYETTEGGILVPCQLVDAIRKGRDSFGYISGAIYFGGEDMRKVSIMQVPAPTHVLQWDFPPTKVVINPICFIGAGQPTIKPGRNKPTCSCGCTEFFRRCLRRGFTDGQCKKCGRRRPVFDKKQKQWRQT